MVKYDAYVQIGCMLAGGGPSSMGVAEPSFAVGLTVNLVNRVGEGVLNEGGERTATACEMTWGGGGKG